MKFRQFLAFGILGCAQSADEDAVQSHRSTRQLTADTKQAAGSIEYKQLTSNQPLNGPLGLRIGCRIHSRSWSL